MQARERATGAPCAESRPSVQLDGVLVEEYTFDTNGNRLQENNSHFGVSWTMTGCQWGTPHYSDGLSLGIGLYG